MPVLAHLVHRKVLRKFFDDRARQRRQVGRGGIVLRMGQAGCVDEVRRLQSEPRRFPVHGVDESFLAACHAFGQGDGRVVSRLHDHAVQQRFDRHAFADRQKHARTRRMPGPLRNTERLRERDPFLAQSVEYDISRHQFGQRCRFDAFVRIASSQNLPALEIHQKVGFRRQRRKRCAAAGRNLGKGQAACEKREKDEEFHHCEAFELYRTPVALPVAA